MHLKTIRLSGFKSFVDPTVIPISGNLIGIVGPNGCGKSNIIDAVRWVMGESSARHLRGDSMADVVFNGSNARKPVSKASVELIFDNADGGAGGEYAGYGEISIRRETGRDGQSDYFLNKSRCRRKDITDLFLGTGLGPRAYSIIEQGMVTRIIEAKPEDLRGFIEEAAGISKYKERRRDTENRIRHAQENLTRVEDIRKELEVQLARLKKQSRAAAKYKEWKQEERLLRAQLTVLRWRELQGRLEAQDSTIRQHQTALEAALASQRAIEADIERSRAQQTEAQDKHNAVQGEYYRVGAEISRLEQAIEHARATRAGLLREQEQLNRSWDEVSTHLESDRKQFEELQRRLQENEPLFSQHTKTRAAAVKALQEAESEQQVWQSEWDAFSQTTAEPIKRRDVQGERIRSLEANKVQLRDRHDRLVEETRNLNPDLQTGDAEALRREAEEIDSKCTRLERSLEDIGNRMQAARAQREQTTAAADQARGEAQANAARLVGLRELHTTVAARPSAAVDSWLRGQGLDRAPRLTAALQVEPGWELAVERVLGSRLSACCASKLDELAREAARLKPAQLTIIDSAAPRTVRAAKAHPVLLDKVQTEIDMAPFLGGVLIAEDLDAAFALRPGLATHESIITREGTWVGPNWLNLEQPADAQAGWLAREREMQALERETTTVQTKLDALQAHLAKFTESLIDLEHERDEHTRQLGELHRLRAGLHGELGQKQEREAQIQARQAQLKREQQELAAQLQRVEEEIAAANEILRLAERESGAHEAKRGTFLERRQLLQERLAHLRATEAAAREHLHKLEIDRQAARTAFDSTRSSITRLEAQLHHFASRREELAQLLAQDQEPGVELREQLNTLLEQRLEIDGRLTQARQALGDLDAGLREQEHARLQEEKHVQEIRGELENQRVARQELLVRRDTQVDQLRETGVELNDVLAALPAEAEEQTWSERLQQLGARIERLGPINLVAIEEFDELSERKVYLDKQYQDLSQALQTLDEAIRKMDRETRDRFKDTFDRVAQGFQNFFPQLFGGGTAYLELTDNDLLESGVTVMARPPGKRNSTIHLLSGGEKALTAVALLFAIFELNPAPFCLLDEVDAPLDDANVERYCETLKTLSARTQLVYVTHNKISMELAGVLIGITMSEPGVSRLVAVDVEEAMQMVAQ